MGIFIGITHYEAVKGVARHFGKRIFILLFGDIVIELVVSQNQQLKITGKKIRLCSLYVFSETGTYNTAFKACGVYNKSAVIYLHRCAVGKPCGNGGGSKLL